MAEPRTTVAALAAAALLAACAHAPPAKPPQLALPQLEGQGEDLRDWWTRFGDARLCLLVDHVLQDNQDLVAAAARADEAAALVRNADDLLPDVNARAGVGRNQTSDRAAFPRFAGIDRRNNSFTLGLDVVYEVDLWGRIRAGDAAVRADLAASRASVQALRSSLAAQTAQTWFRLLATDERLALARQTLQNREAALRIQERRRVAGNGTALEVRQAEAEVAAVAATIPHLVAAQATTERALAVLAGASPAAIVEHRIERGTGALPEPPTVPGGLPADLLARRPDIREAEARLVAASARLDEARARYYPTIRLTGTVGQESKDLDDLFTGPATIWNLAAGLTQPLFGLRKIDAQVDAAEARRRAAEAGYVHTVQRAFAEIHDALSTLRAAGETLAAQDQRATILRDLARIARSRHDAGLGAYFDLLDAERNLLAAEGERIDAAADRLLASIDVFRALGGGWDPATVR